MDEAETAGLLERRFALGARGSDLRTEILAGVTTFLTMGDGWETRRRREPGHDWAVLELGAPGRIEEVVIDTAHFKGNYPDRCFLQAAAESWPVLLPEAKLEADKVHVFKDGIADLGPVRFVRLNIIPDGGVSRLRLIGRVAR